MDQYDKEALSHYVRWLPKKSGAVRRHGGREHRPFGLRSEQSGSRITGFYTTLEALPDEAQLIKVPSPECGPFNEPTSESEA